MPRRKSKKLKQLEEKLKIVKKEIAKRKKLSASSSTPSKSKRNRKAAKSPFDECHTILDKIKKMQYSKAFLEPVDWKALNIPTYPQIIKRPMDLHTIERKLVNNQYHNPYQFANDMRLVYQNATTFNKPSTPYYVAATKFAKKFEEEFERKVVDQHENNSFTRKIHKVVSTLIKRDDSIPFRAPVNPQVLEIPDYLDVIDTPMDLGTILNKINYYTQFKHFVHDLFLVWDNCCRYNPKQNQIHQTALKLREYTQKQLNRLCQSDFQVWQEDDNASPPAYTPSALQMQDDHGTKPETASTSISAALTAYSGAQTTLAPGPVAHLPSDSDPNMNVTIDRNPADTEMSLTEYNDANDDEMQNMTEEPDTVSDDIFKTCDEMEDEEEANKMMIGYLVKKKELNPEHVGSLDFHQKEELQRGIQCLDSDHFDPLINMLQSFIPEGEGEDDEVELDVDSIDDGLQVKMYNYMLQAIHQQEDERIKREGGNVNMNNNNNAMDIEEEEEEEIRHIIHANGKGGIHDPNQSNLVQNEASVDADMNMNEDREEEEDQVEIAMDVSAAEIPNVVTSFPITSTTNTTTASSIPPSIPQNMPNVEPPPEDNLDANHNENEYTFTAAAAAVSHQEEEEEEGNDVEMRMNMDLDMEAHNDNGNDNDNENGNVNEVKDGNDIIADIENVVAINVGDSISMPLLEIESNDHDEEQKMETNVNDNDNDNEATGADVETENNVVEPPIIPTMPPLSADDDDDNNEDQGGMEEQKQNEEQDINIVNPPHNENEVNVASQSVKPLHNENESTNMNDVSKVNGNGNGEENNDDEDVDTPLADDIDF